jgi:threonine aldolase
MNLEQVEKTIRKDPFNYTCVYPETKLICLENTWFGNAVSLDYMKKIKEVADKYSVKVHIDGARIFNALASL